MNFFVTFGQKYRCRERHHTGGHPDGWFRVVANSYDEAREKMFADCGAAWSMMYTPEDFKPEYFPLGELRVIE